MTCVKISQQLQISLIVLADYQKSSLTFSKHLKQMSLNQHPFDGYTIKSLCNPNINPKISY